MDRKANRNFKKILIVLMALAFIALPLLYKAESYAEIEEGLISSDGMINQHPGMRPAWPIFRPAMPAISPRTTAIPTRIRS